MKQKYKLTQEKTPKNIMSTVFGKSIFQTVQEAYEWINKLAPFINSDDKELLRYAINNTPKTIDEGLVPLKTVNIFGADTVVKLKNLENKIEITVGIMTPKMAKVFNRN